MRKKTGRPVVIVIAIIAAAAIILGVIWNAHETRKAANEPPAVRANSSAAPHERKPAKNTPTRTSRKAFGEAEKKRLAVDVEKRMRDWGTDPNIDLRRLAGEDAGRALDELHTAKLDAAGNSVAGMLERPGTDYPAEPSMYCRQKLQTSCAQNPRQTDWWANEAWTYGARWQKGPEAETNPDGTVTVRGSVRVILLQDGDTFEADDWHALTPAWRTYEVNDLITFGEDGKILNVDSLERDPWWIDPYLREWDDGMPGELGGEERVAIPVKGEPRMTLDHALGSRRMKTPATQADLDGIVDWSLWDGLIHYGG